MSSSDESYATPTNETSSDSQAPEIVEFRFSVPVAPRPVPAELPADVPTAAEVEYDRGVRAFELAGIRRIGSGAVESGGEGYPVVAKAEAARSINDATARIGEFRGAFLATVNALAAHPARFAPRIPGSAVREAKFSVGRATWRLAYIFEEAARRVVILAADHYPRR